MTPDVVVIGGGLYGVSAALVAESIGASVKVVSSPRTHEASVAASGYFTPAWFEKGNAREQAYVARGLAEKAGVALHPTGQQIFGYRGGAPKYKPGLETFSPAQALGLRRPDVVAEVTRIDRVAMQVLLANGEHIPYAKGVIVAAGAWTDALLQRSGLSPLGVRHLYGSGIILDNTTVPDVPIWQEIGPYRQYAMREWGEGRIRICATLEVKWIDADPYVAKMLAAMERHLSPNRRVVQHLRGIRPMLDQGPDVVRNAPQVVTSTGGGRIGAIYSFWCAKRACQMLGLQ